MEICQAGTCCWRPLMSPLMGENCFLGVNWSLISILLTRCREERDMVPICFEPCLDMSGLVPHRPAQPHHVPALCAFSCNSMWQQSPAAKMLSSSQVEGEDCRLWDGAAPRASLKAVDSEIRPSDSPGTRGSGIWSLEQGKV